MIGPWFPCCPSCAAWNGDMCELVSHECLGGQEWHPSSAYLESNPEVKVLDWKLDQAMHGWKDAERELRRLRISQLRRMADRADMLATTAEMPYYARFEKTRIAKRLRRFRAACLTEIERLKS